MIYGNIDEDSHGDWMDLDYDGGIADHHDTSSGLALSVPTGSLLESTLACSAKILPTVLRPM